MTRREQIKNIAKEIELAEDDIIDRGLAKIVRLGFLVGAEWADQHPHWIPVEERLPEEGQVVLIHTNGGSVSTACYTDGRFDITELFQAINVTHWMEIVPPRKEDKK